MTEMVDAKDFQTFYANAFWSKGTSSTNSFVLFASEYKRDDGVPNRNQMALSSKVRFIGGESVDDLEVTDAATINVSGGIVLAVATRSYSHRTSDGSTSGKTARCGWSRCS
jgi:hypothetical protein